MKLMRSAALLSMALAGLSVASIASCGDLSHEGTGGKCQPTKKFVALAKKATGWKEKVGSRVTSGQLDGSDVCLVLIWREPRTAGGDRLVTISPKGEVLSVRRGM